MKYLTIICVSSQKGYFEEFSAALGDEASWKIKCLGSRDDAVAAAAANEVDVVVAAEEVAEGSGLDLIKRLVMKNPFINTALVSPLPAEEFHEVTEGLGVLMQLSPTPGKADAKQLRDCLARIY